MFISGGTAVWQLACGWLEKESWVRPCDHIKYCEQEGLGCRVHFSCVEQSKQPNWHEPIAFLFLDDVRECGYWGAQARRPGVSLSRRPCRVVFTSPTRYPTAHALTSSEKHNDTPPHHHQQQQQQQQQHQQMAATKMPSLPPSHSVHNLAVVAG